MRKTSVTYKVLKFIFEAGQVRVNDISLYIQNKYRDVENVNRAIHYLIDNSFVEKKEYVPLKSYHKGDTDAVLTLTPKGRSEVIDNEDDDYYRVAFKLFGKRFYVKEDDGLPLETERIDHILTDNGILAMFATCDIPVFMHEKPSLLYLRKKILGEESFTKDYYLDNLSKEECKELLSSGIFYSISELLEYADEVSRDLSDTISGTRARGIFISNKNCYPVYTSRKFDNKILRVNVKGEKGLINFLQSFAAITEVYREIPELSEYSISSESGRRYLRESYRNIPYAIIVSDGEMLAYSTATGNSKGTVKKMDMALSTKTHEENMAALPSTDRANKASTYLTAASSLYSKMYVVPSNINGVYALSYLTGKSLEDMRNDAIAIAKYDNRFIYEKDSLDSFPYTIKMNGRKHSVIFMPVFEAKTLYRISRSDYNPVIITYADLLNMIAHSIRKEGIYYDADSGDMFDENAVLIYDSHGHIAGERILDNYLKKKGLTFNKHDERYSLPKRFEMDYIEFYNKIARGEMDPEDIEQSITVKEYVPPVRKYVKTERITFATNKDIAAAVKKAAKERGTTASKLISAAIKEYLEI